MMFPSDREPFYLVYSFCVNIIYFPQKILPAFMLHRGLFMKPRALGNFQISQYFRARLILEHREMADEVNPKVYPLADPGVYWSWYNN